MKRFVVALGVVASVAIVARSAVAADLPVKAPVYKAPIVAPYNWTGFYAGGNGGYGWGGGHDIDFTGDDPTSGAGNDFISRVFDGPVNFAAISRSQSIDPEGAFGGLQAGYNWQFGGAWVAGLEADIQGSAIKGSATTVAPLRPLSLTSEQKLKWFGTLRGRLGFLVSDRSLVFGTGGLAYGETEVSSNFVTNGFAGAIGNTTILCGAAGTTCLGAQESKTSVGWTAGGGVEWAAWDKVTFKFEYLHVELDDQTITLVTQPPTSTGNGFVTAEFHNAFDIFRAGLNYRF